MGADVVQTVIVGLVVVAAAAVIARRVFGVGRRDPQPTCAKCVSGAAPVDAARPGAADAAPRPLVFVRAPRR